MHYLYPSDVLKDLKRNWMKRHWTKENIPRLPNDDALQYIIDTAYHASFLTEEARQVRFHIAYMEPRKADSESAQLIEPPLKLQPPRPLTVGEVLRIAPAGDPTMTMIAVFDSKSLGLECNTPLAIWGLLNLGSEHWKFIRGEAQAALAPPGCFTVSVIEPGHLVISRFGVVYMRLQQGKTTGRSARVLSSGPIRDFLFPASNALYNETVRRLKIKKYYNGSDDSYPRDAYFDFLEHVLIKARERRHGGTLLIVPDYLAASDSRLTDRVRIKYVLEGPNPWDILVGMLIAHREYFEHESKVGKAKTMRTTEYHELEGQRNTLDSAHEHLADFASLFASLTSIDGVVLLTDRFRLIGFGAEITAVSPSLETVGLCYDSNGRKKLISSIDSFGMRHRSALRFCSSYEDSVAFIISQDGQIRAAKRVGSEIMLWDDIAIDE